MDSLDVADLVEVAVRNPDTGRYIDVADLTPKHAGWIAESLTRDGLPDNTRRALIKALTGGA